MRVVLSTPTSVIVTDSNDVVQVSLNISKPDKACDEFAQLLEPLLDWLATKPETKDVVEKLRPPKPLLGGFSWLGGSSPEPVAEKPKPAVSPQQVHLNGASKTPSKTGYRPTNGALGAPAEAPVEEAGDSADGDADDHQFGEDRRRGSLWTDEEATQLYKQLSKMRDMKSYSEKQKIRGKEVMPLVAAVHASDLAAVTLCLSKGAPTDKEHNSGECLLTSSASKGAVEVSKLLLMAGCDVSGTSTDDALSSSPLHSAASCGSAECVKLLLDWGGELNARDRAGATPLIAACQSLSDDCVDMLISCGADANICCKDGRSPLLHVAEEGDSAAHLVPKLIEAGADVHATTEDGEGAMHLAVRDGSTKIIEALLTGGGDPSASYEDEDGNEMRPVDMLRDEDARDSSVNETEVQFLIQLLEAAPKPTASDLQARTKLREAAIARQKQREQAHDQEVAASLKARSRAASKSPVGKMRAPLDGHQQQPSTIASSLMRMRSRPRGPGGVGGTPRIQPTDSTAPSTSTAPTPNASSPPANEQPQRKVWESPRGGKLRASRFNFMGGGGTGRGASGGKKGMPPPRVV